MNDLHQVAEYYDAIGRNYNLLRARSDYLKSISEMELEFVLNHVVAGKRVLEVGAGAGFFTRRIVEKAGQTIAIDVSPAMIRILSEEIKRDNFTGLNMALEDLKAVPGFGSFDLVVCMRVLPHVSGLEACLSSMRNALRPGGAAVFDLWNDRSFIMLVRRLRRRSSPVLTNYYALETMRKLIKNAGFQIVTSRGWGYPSVGCLSMDSIGFRLLPRHAYSTLFSVVAV